MVSRSECCGVGKEGHGRKVSNSIVTRSETTKYSNVGNIVVISGAVNMSNGCIACAILRKTREVDNKREYAMKCHIYLFRRGETYFNKSKRFNRLVNSETNFQRNRTSQFDG